MALIQCTECGKVISDRANICLNCGCPVEDILADIRMIHYENIKKQELIRLQEIKEKEKRDKLLYQLEIEAKERKEELEKERTRKCLYKQEQKKHLFTINDYIRKFNAEKVDESTIKNFNYILMNRNDELFFPDDLLKFMKQINETTDTRECMLDFVYFSLRNNQKIRFQAMKIFLYKYKWKLKNIKHENMLFTVCDYDMKISFDRCKMNYKMSIGNNIYDISNEIVATIINKYCCEADILKCLEYVETCNKYIDDANKIYFINDDLFAVDEEYGISFFDAFYDDNEYKDSFFNKYKFDSRLLKILNEYAIESILKDDIRFELVFRVKRNHFWPNDIDLILKNICDFKFEVDICKSRSAALAVIYFYNERLNWCIEMSAESISIIFNNVLIVSGEELEAVVKYIDSDLLEFYFDIRNKEEYLVPEGLVRKYNKYILDRECVIKKEKDKKSEKIARWKKEIEREVEYQTRSIFINQVVVDRLYFEEQKRIAQEKQKEKERIERERIIQEKKMLQERKRLEKLEAERIVNEMRYKDSYKDNLIAYDRSGFMIQPNNWRKKD